MNIDEKQSEDNFFTSSLRHWRVDPDFNPLHETNRFSLDPRQQGFHKNVFNVS